MSQVSQDPELLAKVHFNVPRYVGETHYRWCSVHSLSYSVHEGKRDEGRLPGECPLCYRARAQVKRRGVA